MPNIGPFSCELRLPAGIIIPTHIKEQSKDAVVALAMYPWLNPLPLEICLRLTDYFEYKHGFKAHVFIDREYHASAAWSGQGEGKIIFDQKQQTIKNRTKSLGKWRLSPKGITLAEPVPRFAYKESQRSKNKRSKDKSIVEVIVLRTHKRHKLERIGHQGKASARHEDNDSESDCNHLSLSDHPNLGVFNALNIGYVHVINGRKVYTTKNANSDSSETSEASVEHSRGHETSDEYYRANQSKSPHRHQNSPISPSDLHQMPGAFPHYDTHQPYVRARIPRGRSRSRFVARGTEPRDSWFAKVKSRWHNTSPTSVTKSKRSRFFSRDQDQRSNYDRQSFVDVVDVSKYNRGCVASKSPTGYYSVTSSSSDSHHFSAKRRRKGTLRGMVDSSKSRPHKTSQLKSESSFANDLVARLSAVAKDRKRSKELSTTSPIDETSRKINSNDHQTPWLSDIDNAWDSTRELSGQDQANAVNPWADENTASDASQEAFNSTWDTSKSATHVEHIHPQESCEAQAWQSIDQEGGLDTSFDPHDSKLSSSTSSSTSTGSISNESIEYSRGTREEAFSEDEDDSSDSSSDLSSDLWDNSISSSSEELSFDDSAHERRQSKRAFQVKKTIKRHPLFKSYWRGYHNLDVPLRSSSWEYSSDPKIVRRTLSDTFDTVEKPYAVFKFCIATSENLSSKHSLDEAQIRALTIRVKDEKRIKAALSRADILAVMDSMLKVNTSRRTRGSSYADGPSKAAIEDERKRAKQESHERKMVEAGERSKQREERRRLRQEEKQRHKDERKQKAEAKNQWNESSNQNAHGSTDNADAWGAEENKTQDKTNDQSWGANVTTTEPAANTAGDNDYW